MKWMNAKVALPNKKSNGYYLVHYKDDNGCDVFEVAIWVTDRFMDLEEPSDDYLSMDIDVLNWALIPKPNIK